MRASPALAAALTSVGDRWTLLLVDALMGGPRRFGELQAALDGIAPNVLSQRLKHLESEGLVVASAYSQRPLRFAYALTGGGAGLASALRLLTAWGVGRSPGPEEAASPAHHRCGTPLEAKWWCPTCERVVEDPEADELVWL